MVWMLAWFALFGAGADFIKDFMLGRAFKLKDSVVDTILRVAMLSKYEVYGIPRRRPSEWVGEKLTPPLKWEDAAYRDIMNAIRGKDRKFELWRSVPVIGEHYYWWFGRGRQRLEEKEGTEGPAEPERRKGMRPAG